MDKDLTVLNAKIKSTSLEGDIMVCWLYLELAYGTQAFGGVVLDEPHYDCNGNFIERGGTAFGLQFIKNILMTLEVKNWESLPGTHIRIIRDVTEIRTIGHIIKDKWFDKKEK